MRKSNKKGFTIVELVIVIAVIAILSAVLIPTFGGIIDKANASKDLQEARNAYTEYLIENPTTDVEVVKQNGKFYSVDDFDGVPATSVEDSVVYLDAATGKLDHNNDCADADGEAADGYCEVCGAKIN